MKTKCRFNEVGCLKCGRAWSGSGEIKCPTPFDQHDSEPVIPLWALLLIGAGFFLAIFLIKTALEGASKVLP